MIKTFKANQDNDLPKASKLQAELIREKLAGSLSWTGEVLGKKLKERSFDNACVVLGQFLVLRKNEGLFQ
jgi:hypothetical protein